MKLYVGNLSTETTEFDLQDVFGRFGTVTEATVVADRETSLSDGFGFVTMSSQHEAHAAMKGLHKTDFQGGNLVIAESKMREERPRRATAEMAEELAIAG